MSNFENKLPQHEMTPGNICNKRQKFSAISLYSTNHGQSTKNSAFQKDTIHLIGGQDEFNNNLSSIDEFNIKDMRVFEADWKLKTDISSYSVA